MKRDPAMKRAALLSVSDRAGLPEFARELQKLGFVLLTTSGTAKALTEAGIESVSIESYTGQKEILGGRVKTLHPKIHGGLLAKRNDPDHLRQLEEEEILPIDIAAVNLYPFLQNLHGPASDDPRKMIELVDIGGPTMIRAAAKNFTFVYPVIDPTDYPAVIAAIKQGKEQDSAALDLRHNLAVKVFSKIASYDLAIAKYFCNVNFTEQAPGYTVDKSSDYTLGQISGVVLERRSTLRYGENPHQQASWYKVLGDTSTEWEQLGGKELSYNNLLDCEAAVRLIRSLDLKTPAVAILKHLNPCGAAVAADLVTALKLAKSGDTRSHFGGIVVVNGAVTAALAQEIASDFKEIVIAPDFDKAALEILASKKNMRLMRVPLTQSPRFEYRSLDQGALVQESDQGGPGLTETKLVSKRKPTASELRDLDLAWKLCAHVKSNAITLVKNQTLIAAGAGQMSRIDSVEIALSKSRAHGHDAKGSVCGSDAFFPFTDNIETLAKNGVTAIVTPSGGAKDEEVIAAADAAGISLLFAADRHFRH